MTNTKLTMDAAESLVTCLLEMAEAETNPVLQVITPDLPLEENKKYPADLLQFNHTGWRAYYHCHPATRAGNHRFNGEHGHFHIFVRTQNEPEKWSHLVALAMDNMGQALGWFTVNHWVTGETWQDSEILSEQLESIPYDQQEHQKQNISNIVERWLLSLLAVSREQVKMVLHERDKILQQKELNQAESDIKQDKGIYILSEIPINLMDLLKISEDES